MIVYNKSGEVVYETTDTPKKHQKKDPIFFNPEFWETGVPEDVCSICLEPIFNFKNTVETFECGHKFHTNEVMDIFHFHYEVPKYIFGVAQCPMCRQDLLITNVPTTLDVENWIKTKDDDALTVFGK